MNILFLLQPGKNSRSIFLDMIMGAREAGHRVLIWELAPLWQICQRAPEKSGAIKGDLVQMIGAFLQENLIDLTVGMWANDVNTFGLVNHGGRVVSLFEAMGRPHLHFWLDSPERAHGEGSVQLIETGIFKSRHLHHLINNDGTAEEMRRYFGFTNVIALPYGVSLESFKGTECERKEYDVMYSAGGGDRWQKPTEAMLEEVKKGEPDVDRIREELAAEARGRLDGLCAGFEGNVRGGVRKVLEGTLGLQLADRAMPVVEKMERVVREDEGLRGAAEALLRNRKAYVEAMLAIRGIESFERTFTFVYLSRYFKCAMFGDVDFSAWGCGVKSKGFVEYADQGKMYSTAKLGLSVMRWQDEVGLHIKPLEIAASGTACVAGYREGIGELFVEGEEVVTYRNLVEAKERIGELVGDEERVVRIARAGRARVEKDHTWAKRFEQIVGQIKAKMPG